ncbi:MAG: adenosylmethionine decarboxylase [Gammaproteobacteria bacterium]
MDASRKKLKLEGFNNLTKAFSFNIYDVCYAQTLAQRREYIKYIDEAYNAQRLTRILTDVADIVGATVLNIAHQDYHPQGASATMLIAEEVVLAGEPKNNKPLTLTAVNDVVLAHLDKSHIAVHTYPESHPRNGISTFRADIDVVTCGYISPLKALDYLIKSFESDIVIMDYRVRGFTRDITGHKHFLDHQIASIQDFIGHDTKKRYHMVDVNLPQEKMFHTKMMLKGVELDNYLFAINEQDLSHETRRRIKEELQQEIEEIFYGWNFCHPWNECTD